MVGVEQRLDIGDLEPQVGERIACARKMPLMPPALAPATMSTIARRRMPVSSPISSSSA
jgi:hypothetical protein